MQKLFSNRVWSRVLSLFPYISSKTVCFWGMFWPEVLFPASLSRGKCLSFSHSLSAFEIRTQGFGLIFVSTYNVSFLLETM